MFKVGDKVTCLLRGKGVVIEILKEKYCILVEFKNQTETYTDTGFSYEDHTVPYLYHGHGTFKIEFVEDKKPEYEWQWLYLDNNGYYETTAFHKTEESIKTHYGVNTKIFYRIEESKREAKHG